MRYATSRAQRLPTTHTPTPTKTTEKELTDSLHINSHGMTLPTTPQRTAFDSRNQKELQSPSVRPRQPLFVRVIRNSPTTAKQFHSPSQSATTPTTHSMPTIVPNTDHGSEAQPHRPRLIVRIRRNLPPVNLNTHPSSPDTRTDHLATRTSNSRPTFSTTSGNLPCSTVERCNGRRRIVLVRRKGESVYPNIRQQQHQTNPTERSPYSGARQQPAALSNMPPSITAPSKLHQTAPTILETELHSSSSTVTDNHSTTSSDTPGSARNQLTEYPAFPAPTIEHSTAAFNRSTSELLPPTEISSRALTVCSFLRRYSVSVVPD